jgi:hypothetical protein
MFMLPKMKSGTVPLSGGARAGRPWGGLCVESDDPPRLAPRPLSLRQPPLQGGDFSRRGYESSQDSW